MERSSIMIKIEKNIGLIDKLWRIAFAVIVEALYFMNIISGNVAVVLGAVAGVLLLTALFNFCGLYKILGISTCKKCDKETS